jgi:IS30 family transposase
MRLHHQDRRRQRRGIGARKPPIPDLILIDQRPETINRRRVPGHWEGDMIIGKANRSQVGVLVERRTLFLALVRLESPARRDRSEGLLLYPEALLQPDAAILDLRSGIGDAPPSTSHQKHRRRSLLRPSALSLGARYRRKHQWTAPTVSAQGQDLSQYTQKQLDDIAWSMNIRPRNTLKWKAPAELFLPKGQFNFAKYWASIINTVALGS